MILILIIEILLIMVYNKRQKYCVYIKNYILDSN